MALDCEGDIVHEGWLTKSPPLETKKQLFNQSLIQPKWRRRWFVLRQGAIPGQFLLQYFVDESAKKQKGSIDLDQCEQVDTGLTFESGKVRYQYMFDIKTPKRVYYLAADSEVEMTRWVDYVCRVCGLHTFQAEEADSHSKDTQAAQLTQHSVTETRSTPAVTSQPASYISGPYMHLSECFTGGHPTQVTRTPRLSSGSGPHPGLVAPPRISPQYQNNPIGNPDDSLNCGDDSVFLPNSPAGPKSKLPSNPSRTTHSSEDGYQNQPESIANQFSNISVSNPPHQEPVVGPGRPPKPPNLRNTQVSLPSQPPNDTYENHDDMQTIFLDTKTAGVTNSAGVINQETNNNCETLTSAAVIPHPPTVDRRLKPEVKSVPSNPLTPTTLPAGYSGPPVERYRKPRGFDTPGTYPGVANTNPNLGAIPPGMVIPGNCNWERDTWEEGSQSEGGSRRNSSDEQIYFYMPSLQQSTGGKWDPLMIPAHDMRDQAVQYLDLDLPIPDTSMGGEVDRVNRENDVSTVYKTVDFIKTEAFNRTRQKVEEYRYNKKQDK
eukprot:GFUD01042440.1.p1 GENE.GFUD01042440.1~~GFUD01042440.1.p1  ORF type:complete len:583 (+),score=143.25 GFUD01042440.1:110-1750(+)